VTVNCAPSKVEFAADNQPMPRWTEFRLAADAKAQAWLDAHPSAEPRVIAFDVRRCCGGGKICHVSVRNLAKKDRRDGYVIGTLDDGTTVLIDRKAAARLPSRFRITVRGLGPMKHLDLDLDGEQWGALLYD